MFDRDAEKGLLYCGNLFCITLHMKVYLLMNTIMVKAWGVLHVKIEGLVTVVPLLVHTTVELSELIQIS